MQSAAEIRAELLENTRKIIIKLLATEELTESSVMVLNLLANPGTYSPPRETSRNVIKQLRALQDFLTHPDPEISDMAKNVVRSRLFSDLDLPQVRDIKIKTSGYMFEFPVRPPSMVVGSASDLLRDLKLTYEEKVLKHTEILERENPFLYQKLWNINDRHRNFVRQNDPGDENDENNISKADKLNRHVATAYTQYFHDALFKAEKMAKILVTHVKYNHDITTSELVDLSEIAFNEISAAFGIISRYDLKKETNGYQVLFNAENEIIEALTRWYTLHNQPELAFECWEHISNDNPAFVLRRFDHFYAIYNHARNANLGPLESFMEALPWCTHRNMFFVSFMENQKIYDSCLLEAAGILSPVKQHSLTPAERITLLQYVILTHSGSSFQPLRKTPNFFDQPITITTLEQLNQQKDAINYLWLEVASIKKKEDNAPLWWYSDSLIQPRLNTSPSQ